MKILIIRFSSIGDIVLTTPVIRCLKQQLPDVEIHYLTKEIYRPLLEANPYINKIITIQKSVNEVVQFLKFENYTYIIDLHKNLRTFILLVKLGRKAHAFNKLNIKKWLVVRLKINLLPKLHIVDRYLKTVDFLGISNDFAGLDYFIPQEVESILSSLPEPFRSGFVAIITGAKQITKQIPAERILSLCQEIDKPIVLIGGKEDFDKGDWVVKECPNKKVMNACGKFNLNESAYLLKQASIVITADTGMMHISAALKKEIVSVWGNTIPEFGMSPYFPKGLEDLSHVVELRGLPCRPCTKLGFDHCPRGHFLCMRGIDDANILKWIK
jgi:ADP-heptose:LPS heptosyltransferase